MRKILIFAAAGICVVFLLLFIRAETVARRERRIAADFQRRGREFEVAYQMFFESVFFQMAPNAFNQLKHDAAAVYLREAIQHGRHALNWKTSDRKAQGLLLAIASSAEVDSDPKMALAAYQELRASLLSARHLWQPQAQLLSELNDKIADLTAVGDVSSRPGRLQDLQNSIPKSSPWGLVMELVFVVWVIATLRMIQKSFDADGKLVPASFALYFSLMFCSLCVWLELLAHLP